VQVETGDLRGRADAQADGEGVAPGGEAVSLDGRVALVREGVGGQSQCRVQASGREVFEAPRALAKNTPSNVIPFGTLIPTEDRYPRVKSPANSRVPPRSPYYPQ
jgi:hypothetical protein